MGPFPQKTTLRTGKSTIFAEFCKSPECQNSRQTGVFRPNQACFADLEAGFFRIDLCQAPIRLEFRLSVIF